MKFVISSQNRDAYKTVLSKFEVGYVALYGQRLSIRDVGNSWVLIDQNEHRDTVGGCCLTLSTVDPFKTKSREILEKFDISPVQNILTLSNIVTPRGAGRGSSSHISKKDLKNFYRDLYEMVSNFAMGKNQEIVLVELEEEEFMESVFSGLWPYSYYTRCDKTHTASGLLHLNEKTYQKFRRKWQSIDHFEEEKLKRIVLG